MELMFFSLLRKYPNVIILPGIPGIMISSRIEYRALCYQM
jgi:hypothetical protein